MVKSIMERHGDGIEIKSQVGRDHDDAAAVLERMSCPEEE